MQILVVDDHLPTIELMRLTLTSFGHSVSTATNVADALQIIATDRPEVVLSDITFTGGAKAQDGHDLAKAVRSDHGHCDVAMVAITGLNSPAKLQAALDSGFDEVIVKPFAVTSLIERIDSYSRQQADW